MSFPVFLPCPMLPFRNVDLTPYPCIFGTLIVRSTFPEASRTKLFNYKSLYHFSCGY